MTNSRSTPRNIHWLAIASLAIAGLAMNVGCSSSSSSPADSGVDVQQVDSKPDTQVVHNISYTFDSDAQMWAFSTFADMNSFNLTGAYVTADAGSTTDGSTEDGSTGDAGAGDGGTAAKPPVPTLEWDGTVGQPDKGSLKITATFTDCKQYVDPGINFMMPKNETGRMLKGRLQVASGTFSGGAQLHVVTGSDFAYQSAQFTIQPDGTFGTATLDLTNPVGTVNPAQVLGVGIQIYTGDTCPYPSAGMQVVFNIDTVTD